MSRKKEVFIRLLYCHLDCFRQLIFFRTLRIIARFRGMLHFPPLPQDQGQEGLRLVKVGRRYPSPGIRVPADFDARFHRSFFTLKSCFRLLTSRPISLPLVAHSQLAGPYEEKNSVLLATEKAIPL